MVSHVVQSEQTFDVHMHFKSHLDENLEALIMKMYHLIYPMVSSIEYSLKPPTNELDENDALLTDGDYDFEEGLLEEFSDP